MLAADPANAAELLSGELADPSRCSGTHPQSLSNGAAGVALLHAERAAHGHDPAVLHRWLTAASAGGADTGLHATATHGVAAIAAALHGAAGYRSARETAAVGVDRVIRSRLHTAHARIDAQQRPRLAEFDIINGLAGFGTHLLRTDPDGTLIREVLLYLVRLTHPHLDGHPGWWSNQPLPSRLVAPGGHSNHGLAHGITGPLAVLSLATRRGITVPGQLGAIGRITTWLDTWQNSHPHGPWWPEIVTATDLRRGTSSQRHPGRPSWCYGTPGIARAHHLAGQATGNATRLQLGEAALTGCHTDPEQYRRLTDPGLCHGLASLYQVTWRMAADSPTSSLTRFLPRLAGALATTQTPRPSGFLEGDAGVALALSTAANGAVATGWDAVLALA